MRDHGAWIDRLYREHGRSILAYMRRMVGAHDVAEDLLQETFAQALARPDRLAEAVSARAWLFGIARHLGLNRLRRHRTTVPLPIGLRAPAPADPDPRLDQMREAIAALPDHQQEPLTLRLQQDLTYAEIAAVLDVPIGTVRSRLHHAVRRLRETMTGRAP